MAVPTFSELCEQTSDPLGMSLLLLMSWVSSCDGSVEEEELGEMRAVIGAGPAREHIPALLAMVRRGDLVALEGASRIVKTRVAPERRRLFLTLIVRIALADGYLRTTESHVLRFVADLLDLSPAALSEVFDELSGKPFPPPGDPSRASWWKGANRPGNGAGEQKASPANSSPLLPRLRALAMLGLGETATPDQIRAAFRRMSLVHHPDRFASLGTEAVHAATESFRRIQEAHEYLTDA